MGYALSDGINWEFYAPPEEPRWFACRTLARAEKRVAGVLEENGFEVFLPLHIESSEWTDRKQSVQKPLYAGYVFSRFTRERLSEVLRVPRLASVVKLNGRDPTPVPDEDIEDVRRLLEGFRIQQLVPEPIKQYITGQRVRMLDPTFRGTKATVIQHRGRNVIVAVGVSIIGQYHRLTTRADLIEPLVSDA